MRPTAKCSLLALAALLLAGGAARADWLLTRDGARVETKGPWKVDGRRVTAELRLAGTRFARAELVSAQGVLPMAAIKMGCPSAR